MPTKLLLVPCAIGFFSVALTCSAAPLPRAAVPAKTGWVLHIDEDTLHQTVIGRYLDSKPPKPEAQLALAFLQTHCNFDPRTSLHGLTLFSASGKPEDGVLLLEADVDSALFSKSTAGIVKDYQSTPYRQYAVSSWINEKKPAVNGVQPRTYAAIYNNRLVVLAQKKSSVTSELDVLDGLGPSLASSGDLPELGSGASGITVEGAARDTSQLVSNPNAAVFRESKGLRLKLGETNGQVAAELTLIAENPTAATHMASIGNGLIALGQMRTADPDALQFAQGLSITQDGRAVTVKLNLAAAAVVAHMQAKEAQH